MSNWNKRFDEWHSANFIDEGIIGTRKQEREKIKTYIAKQRKEIIGEDEPQHSSGKDRDKINIRNALREEQRKVV